MTSSFASFRTTSEVRSVTTTVYPPSFPLARALLLNTPILVLDDCLSSVDAQTEDEILKGLRSVFKEKTSVIISHRISAVKEADEILVLEEGRIIERGTHQQLLQRDGLYAELFRKQQLTEELERI